MNFSFFLIYYHDDNLSRRIVEIPYGKKKILRILCHTMKLVHDFILKNNTWYYDIIKLIN